MRHCKTRGRLAAVLAPLLLLPLLLLLLGGDDGDADQRRLPRAEWDAAWTAFRAASGNATGHVGRSAASPSGAATYRFVVADPTVDREVSRTMLRRHGHFDAHIHAVLAHVVSRDPPCRTVVDIGANLGMRARVCFGTWD